MTELPFERAAMKNEPMPEGLDNLDALMYQSLALLYLRYHMNGVTRESAAIEKGKLCYAYDRQRRIAASDRRLVEQSAKMFKNIEGAANAYGRERTVENADRLYEAIYRMTPSVKEEENNAQL